MNKDQKKQKQDKKIVPFEMNNEIFADPDIDQMLKQSLIQEADELEAELNTDPNLTGVGASDDLLQSVVGKLKEQGIWEEEEQETAAGISVEEFSIKEHSVGKEAEISAKPESDMKINAESAMNTEINEEFRADMESTESRADLEKTSTATPQNLEDLYAMLPEADRRAMELGRELEKKQERRAARKQRRRRVLRYGGTAAAILAVVFGVSMTSEANRRLVQKAWGMMAANFNFHVQTDYVGDDEQIRSKSREEVEAMEEISENLGVSAISFEYLPDGMEYDSYEIITDSMEAVIFYVYQEKAFYITIINVNAEGSTYYVMDERADLVDSLITEQEFTAKIWETNQEQSQEDRAYIAEIDYENCRYILNGMLSLDEMKKIVNSAFIL